MTRALATRLKKIEAKRQVRRVFSPMIFTCYADEVAGDIVALSNGRDRIERLYGESDLGAFAGRVGGLLCAPGLPVLLCGHHAEPEAFPAPDAVPAS